MMSFRRKKRGKPQVNIVPLVDVMTFLISFFMVFSTFHVSSTALTIKLPKAVTATRQSTGGVVVSIDRSGEVFLNERKVTLGKLREELESRIKRRPDETVVIRADSLTRYSKLVEVMDAARLAGATHLALAAEVPR